MMELFKLNNNFLSRLLQITDSTLLTLNILLLLLIGMATSEHSTFTTSAVSKASASFTRDFYSILKTEFPKLNLIFSPFSLSACVGMVKAGAGGTTATEIQKGMHYPDDAVLFNGYQKLLEGLTSNENFTLETANSIYTKTGFKLDIKYEALVRNSFGAKVEQLDFSDGAGSAKKINKFVEEVTQNKIKDLVSKDSLTPDTRLVLVNAIYFKGLWRNKFDEKLTTKEKFYVSSGNEITVDMMKITSDFLFGDIPELDAKAISLPYKGDRLTMIVILPNKQNGLVELETKLKTFDLGSILSKLYERKVQLSMPRFKLESEIDLRGPLEALGMKSMFDERKADLSGIPDHSNPEPLYVSKAVQKAFLEVNEEGSEAAAATAIQVNRRTSQNHRLKILTLNHPFIAFIQDSPHLQHHHHHHRRNFAADSNILFMSSVVDPSQSELIQFSIISQVVEEEEEEEEIVVIEVPEREKGEIDAKEEIGQKGRKEEDKEESAPTGEGGKVKEGEQEKDGGEQVQSEKTGSSSDAQPRCSFLSGSILFTTAVFQFLFVLDAIVTEAFYLV